MGISNCGTHVCLESDSEVSAGPNHVRLILERTTPGSPGRLRAQRPSPCADLEARTAGLAAQFCRRQPACRAGIRTPWTEVPTMLLSGVGNDGPLLAQLVGIGDPFDKATLARLYPGGKDEYLRRFGAALERAIAAGHLLPEDRAEILAVAAINYDKAP